MNMINITLDKFMKIINSTNFRTKNFLFKYRNRLEIIKIYFIFYLTCSSTHCILKVDYHSILY